MGARHSEVIAKEITMQAIEVRTEGDREVQAGLVDARARDLNDIVLCNRPMFYKRAFRFLGDAADAEDAVQDALLSACKHFAQFRGEERISTWLTAIVTNAARVQLRRRRGVYLSFEQQDTE